MFTRLSFHQSYLSLKFIRLYARYAPRRRHLNPNPGINKQLKIFKDVPEITENPEAFDDFETDFMNVHESHKQYEVETSKHKEQIRLWIIKNKYFKTRQPNFLTYAEKEQIKLLHSRDPNEWTPEKLSESFPADIETIIKVIKANWKAESKERILKHDETVMRNWSLYKEGKLTNLNDDLKTHIDKFADRKIEDLKNRRIDWEPKPSLPTPNISEFSKIITSCKKYTNESKMIQSSEETENKHDVNDRNYENIKMNKNMKNECPGEDETFLIDKIVDKRPMRYEDVKRIKNLPNNNQNEFESNDEIQENQSENEVKATQNPFNSIQKFETHEVEICKEDMKKYDVTPIKQRIHIPRKLWRKNATYKVEDCYYDYDGEFLYRVPGMTGKNIN